VARAPERRVENQRTGRRIEPDHRRGPLRSTRTPAPRARARPRR
jgi:hypothetical protein